MNIWTLITRRQFKATHFQTFRVDNTEEYMVNILSWKQTKHISFSSVDDWNRTFHLVVDFTCMHACVCWVGVLAVVPCPVFPPGCPPGRHCANPPPPQGYTLCVSRENQPGKQDKKLFSAQSRKLSFFHLRLFQLVFLFTVLLIFSAFPPALRPQIMYMRVLEVFEWKVFLETAFWFSFSVVIKRKLFKIWMYWSVFWQLASEVQNWFSK